MSPSFSALRNAFNHSALHNPRPCTPPCPHPHCAGRAASGTGNSHNCCTQVGLGSSSDSTRAAVTFLGLVQGRTVSRRSRVLLAQACWRPSPPATCNLRQQTKREEEEDEEEEAEGGERRKGRKRTGKQEGGSLKCHCFNFWARSRRSPSLGNSQYVSLCLEEPNLGLFPSQPKASSLSPHPEPN